MLIFYNKVTPLTAMKFAELVVRAGIPPGVVNILPGKGIIINLYFIIHVLHLNVSGSAQLAGVRLP